MRWISNSIPVARKNYGCAACVWITEGLPDVLDGFTFSELRSIVKARNNGWRVLKGEKHLQATVIGCNEEIFSWRAIPEIHNICLKYDIYQDDIC